MVAKTYSEFIESKCQLGSMGGFDPLYIPDEAFDFQRFLLDWSIRKGRSAIFADCGLGKSLMELAWCENAVRKSNRPALIVTPLAVAQQFITEAEKFGIDCRRSTDGRISGPAVYVTNYERLHHFDPGQFDAVACDESSAIKNFEGKRREIVTEFMRMRPYRLLCTATAAPNDYHELGTSSEALGELGRMDMMGRFFRNVENSLNPMSVKSKWSFKPHAEPHFWRWVCSWARACRKPSDLGFSDSRFALPKLSVSEHVVKASRPAPGRLFDVNAVSLDEVREEQRRTIPERCEKAASLINGTGKPAVAWCYLNDEGDTLAKLIPDSVQVSGSDSDEKKEEVFQQFAEGKIRVLVTKPKIAGFGLNWQHCSHMTFFPSHSFEQYYQSVRRCWRFGQKNSVTVDLITTDGGAGVKANMQRKAEAADKMFVSLVEMMSNELKINRTENFRASADRPSWLATV